MAGDSGHLKHLERIQVNSGKYHRQISAKPYNADHNSVGVQPVIYIVYKYLLTSTVSQVPG